MERRAPQERRQNTRKEDLRWTLTLVLLGCGLLSQVALLWWTELRYREPYTQSDAQRFAEQMRHYNEGRVGAPAPIDAEDQDQKQ